MAKFCDILLTMSLSAGLVALVVMFLRLFLAKVPRWLTCLLWAVVFFRMVCPGSFDFPVSLLPESLVNGTVAQMMLPALPTVVFSIWAIGAAGMLLWALISYGKLRQRIREAVLWQDNIYLSDQIETPFVCGIFRPRVYLPVGLDPARRDHVILHEQAHIQRKDHIIKPLAYLALCFHWFNPVLWGAFRLFSEDVETACDQKVIDNFSPKATADYAETLLHLGRDVPLPQAAPLAFGEGDAKERIQAVLSYEKPVMGVLLAAFLVCVLTGVALAADPEESGTRLDWYPVTQGVILWEGEERGLFDDLVRELVVLLEKTQRESYIPCEAPVLPDETITLYHPGSNVRYHFVMEGVDAPRLFRQTRAGWKTASLHDTFGSRYQSDFDAYQRWAGWSADLSALLEPDAAAELYTLRTEARNDLDAYKTILDALGLEEVIGPYTLTYFRESWVDNVTIVIEEPPQTRQERQWFDGFLRSRGKLFLALATDPDYLSWYYPDNVGSRTERKLLPYTEELGQDSRQISQRDFAYLYAQRRLWWWDAMASPNTVTVNGSVPVIYHPAYYISEVIYTNETVGDDALYLGLTELNPGYSEYIIREDYLYESLNKNQGGHGVSVSEYRPLEDYTVSDPVHHPENLLTGQTVLAAWEADPGYRIYQTDNGLYLARWRPVAMDSPEQYLAYFFRLEEKPVSDDRNWPVPEDWP